MSRRLCKLDLNGPTNQFIHVWVDMWTVERLEACSPEELDKLTLYGFTKEEMKAASETPASRQAKLEMSRWSGCTSGLTVIAPGTTVKLGPGPNQTIGQVVAVSIEAGPVVTYLVSWWNDNNRNEQTLPAHEIEKVEGPERLTIGFK